MRKFNHGAPDRGHEPMRDGDFNRDDSSASNLDRFAKDRRKITSDQREGGYAGSGRTSGTARGRKSFNPNFTRDNKPAGRGNYGAGRGYRAAEYGAESDYEDNRFNRYDYDERRGTAPRRSDSAAPRKTYGEGQGRGRTAEPSRGGRYGKSPRQAYGRGEQQERPYSEEPRRSYGDGRRPNAGARGEERKPYGKRYGDGRRSETGAYGDSRRPAPHGRKGQGEERRSYPRYSERHEGAVRLNRFIAMSGLCSRREADTYIEAGVVTVNGVVVTELGSKVLPTDVVKFNDSVIRGEQKVYLVMNKPKGYVTTLDDPNADKTVMDLIKGACAERIYPVGRLDKNSLGVLLFTNDGELTRQLTHPSFNKKKIYQVTLDKALTHADMEAVAEGVVLEDGEIAADAIDYIGESRKEVGIEIHSGRNRIVRRIFEHLGYKVVKLDRVYFAGLTKKNLKRGGWRFLTPVEVARLKSGGFE